MWRQFHRTLDAMVNCSTAHCLCFGAASDPLGDDQRCCGEISKLVVAAFRRLLRQQGAFLHQQRGEMKSVWWWCETLIEQVSQDAVKELKIPLLQPMRCAPTCRICTKNIDAVRVSPTQIESTHLPPIVNISEYVQQAGDLLRVLPTNSLHASTFREMCITPVERP